MILSSNGPENIPGNKVNISIRIPQHFNIISTRKLRCHTLYLKTMKVVIVIPTYNEKDNIDSLLHKICVVMGKIKGWTWEILVVDDGSPDGTADIVRERAKRSRRIKLISDRPKEGLGAAYLAGMEKAFDGQEAEVVITMDADLSHNPVHLPLFLEEVNKGADLVIGSRYMQGGTIPKNWGLHRKFFSIFGNQFTSFILKNTNLSDWTSGYKAIKKELFKKIAPHLDKIGGYTFNISFVYYSQTFGAKITEIPIKFTERKSGKSKLGLEYLFQAPKFVIMTRLANLIDSIVSSHKK